MVCNMTRTSKIVLPPAEAAAERARQTAEGTWRSVDSANYASRSAATDRMRDEFDQLHADLNRVLNWIAFRKDLRLTDDERSSELFRRLSYQSREGIADGNPQRALALALRNGGLVAFDTDGKQLPKEFWVHRGFGWRRWPRVVFRWPEVQEAFPTIGPTLKEVLCESLRDNPNLSQTEAGKIARSKGLVFSRQQLRGLWEGSGGSTKPGPRGRRKNRAEPMA